MNLLEVGLGKLSEILGTDLENGLTAEQVLQNRREFGENVLFEKKNTWIDILKKVFGDIMMVLFLLVSMFDFLETGELSSLVAAISVIVLYATFVLISHGYVSSVNRKIERFSREKYHVRRAGRITSVDKSELVPGDILLLEKGDIMPCDGIILKHRGLKILEASVTGRRVPVFKRSHEEVEDEESGFPYFECILFAGSVILHGSTKVFVCNTGRHVFDNQNFTVSRQNTSVPQIYDTAMELKKQISLVWVIACFFLFVWGVFFGNDVFGAFHYSVALVIAAFPDAIEHLSDLAIAYMSSKLFSEGVILRNPGSVDRLCDVDCVFVNSGDYLFYSHPIAGAYYAGNAFYEFRDNPKQAYALLENLLFAQNSKDYFSGKREEWNAEKAILSAAASIGIQKPTLYREYLHINHYDLDPKYGFSCSLVMKDGVYRLIIRGKLKNVLSACTYLEENGKSVLMNESHRTQIRANSRHLAGICEKIEAVATLALSSPSTGDQRSLCHGMTFVGLFGLSTPISAAAANAVNTCQKSGIRTCLLTDDFPETVVSLAKSVSIIGEEDYQYALSFQSYQRMDRGVFVADIEKYKAYCGFPVEEKQSIVKYNKDNGSITMSLTDGIYDTLPQMESDISVVSASEKQKAVRLNADLLFREKRYELVPLCINWARIFYRNIVHVMQYVLLLQFAFGVTVFISLSTSGKTPVPLLPMVLAGLGVCIPFGLNIFHCLPGPRLENNKGVLKDDRVSSLQVLIIIPLIAGFSQALAVMLSQRISLYASGSSLSASSATLITMIYSSYFSSLSIKYDEPVFRKIREFGKTELFTFLAAVAASILLTATPIVLLWQESVTLLRFWPALFAVLTSLLPGAVMEFMKYLKKEDDSAEGLDHKSEKGETL